MDAMNVAVLLGLSEDQARQAVFGNVDHALRHGEARRHKYLPVRVTSMASFDEKCKMLATSMIKTKGSDHGGESVSRKRKGGQKAKKAKGRRGENDDEDDDQDDEGRDEVEVEDGYHIPGSSLVEDTHEDHEENEDFLQF